MLGGRRRRWIWETGFTLGRVGISMKGRRATRETRLLWTFVHKGGGLQPKPVLTWKVIIGQLKTVEREASVGYGGAWIARGAIQFAIFPVG